MSNIDRFIDKGYDLKVFKHHSGKVLAYVINREGDISSKHNHFGDSAIDAMLLLEAYLEGREP